MKPQAGRQKWSFCFEMLMLGFEIKIIGTNMGKYMSMQYI